MFEVCFFCALLCWKTLLQYALLMLVNRHKLCIFGALLTRAYLGLLPLQEIFLNAPFLLFGMTFAPQELPLCLHTYQSFYHNCVQNSIVFAQLVYLTTPNAVFCGKIWENVYLLWQTCTLLGKIVYLRKLLQLSQKEKNLPNLGRFC